MTGKIVEIAGFVLAGGCLLGLILSEVIFRARKRKIAEKVYSKVE